MRIWNKRLHRQNFPLHTLFLRLIPKYKETCRVNTSRNSKTFLNNRTWPNSAPMLVSPRTLRKDSSSIKLDDAPDEMKGSCRECALPRSEKSSRVRGWIRGNTKIGSVLDVRVCHHQERYGVEIMIGSLFRDRTVSWVHIVNGINKYVIETSEEILVTSVENRGTGETCREGSTTTKAYFDVVSCVHSLSWTKMDRRWNRKNWVKVVSKCQNVWSDCCDMMIQVIEKMIEL